MSRSQSPHPRGPGRGRGSGPALGGGTAPQPHLRGILVYSVPPPPSSARPAVPSASVAPGPPVAQGGICFERLSHPFRAPCRRSRPVCPSVPRGVRPRSKATQRALNAAHIPPLRLRPLARPAASSAWDPGGTRLPRGNRLCPRAEQAANHLGPGPENICGWRECGNKKPEVWWLQNHYCMKACILSFTKHLLRTSSVPDTEGTIVNKSLRTCSAGTYSLGKTGYFFRS